MEIDETYLRPSSLTSVINVKVPSNFPEAEMYQIQAKTKTSTQITPAFPKVSHGAQALEFKSSISQTGSRCLGKSAQIQKAVKLLPQTAVLIIEKAWISYRDKQMFRLLKHSVCAAENSLSYEILRKVTPREAELFSDKSQQVKIRFRFGGEEFPPMIFFKIFIHGAAQKVKYISGKKMIRPATEAAEDSLRQMGNRMFYDQILKDTLWQQHCSITDETDITTLKDYMQYLSNLDESPAQQGGKENYWRKLTLDILPRRTLFFDIVDFAYNNRITPRLKEEIATLISLPITQEVLIQHIQAISRLRVETHQNSSSPAPYKTKVSEATNHSQFSSRRSKHGTDHSEISSRRSKQARLRVLKMRHIYSRENSEKHSKNSVDSLHYKMSEREAALPEEEEDEWDCEAKELYEWTQELSFHDDITHTSLVTN